jgi:hypothetical protein
VVLDGIVAHASRTASALSLKRENPDQGNQADQEDADYGVDPSYHC